MYIYNKQHMVLIPNTLCSSESLAKKEMFTFKQQVPKPASLQWKGNSTFTSMQQDVLLWLHSKHLHASARSQTNQTS